MTDDPDTVTGPEGNMLPAGLAAAEAELRLRTSLDLEGRQVTQATFAAGEVIAFAAGSPYARCLRGGEPVVFDRPDSQTLDQARPAGREMMSRYASFLALPAVSGGQITFDQGILALRTALSHRHVQLETACDTLIASLAEHYEDDVTVVLARIQQPETPDTGEAEKIRSEYVRVTA